jgi:hypothetical protein
MQDTVRKEYLQEKNYLSNVRVVGLALILLGGMGCASYKACERDRDLEQECHYRNPVWRIMHDSIFGNPSEYRSQEER